ncbi:DinB superfamily protein [compost metagenome]
MGDKTINQLPEEKLFWQYNEESNSIVTIVKHMSGNMKSRWTDFLTTDGEKETRNREAEFDNDLYNKEEVLKLWNDGWKCLFNTIYSLKNQDLEKEIFIRNMGHTVMEAINRQLAHYPYHIGQMVFIGKMVCGKDWISLSIPRGQSDVYNAEKFAKSKHTEHFTAEFIKKK